MTHGAILLVREWYGGCAAASGRRSAPTLPSLFARDEANAPATVMPAAANKSKQKIRRNPGDADLRFRLAVMDIRLISQTPKSVFTKQRARLSIFFADEKR